MVIGDSNVTCGAEKSDLSMQMHAASHGIHLPPVHTYKKKNQPSKKSSSLSPTIVISI